MALEVASRMALNGPRLSKSIASTIPATIAKRSLPLARAASLPILRAQQQRRQLSSTPRSYAPNQGLLGINNSHNAPSSYFQRPSLPANTIIRFVPQQTAWIVERMGKFNRILEPGLAILVPFLDRIAYVKSLKEAAIEIPSQSAITADNVTLELDGNPPFHLHSISKANNLFKVSYIPEFLMPTKPATESKTLNMPSPNSPKQPCVQKSAS
jgi:SPFH domain / Band 7 family